jgi:glutamine synthetase
MRPLADYAQTQAWLSEHPEIRFVDLLLPDLLGIPRGKRVTVEQLADIHRNGLLLPASMFALHVLGETIQETGLGFEEGDADRICLPVAGSLVAVPWLGPQVAQMQISMFEQDRRPFYGDPRHVLENVLARFGELKLTPVVAVEMEFYFVDCERTHDGYAQPPRRPLSGRRALNTQVNSMAALNEYSEVLSAIDAAAQMQEIPVGTALAECGPAQFEVNLHHVADALLACDHALRLKRLIKGVALQHGLQATFMAKPYREQVGSGTHLHVSLLDENGRNVFAAEAAEGSELLTQAIGGLADTMSATIAVCAPTANSYRRYQSEAYVPLAPCWSVNNRGVAFRIPAGPPSSRRIEHRVAGADANPYLLCALVLAGLHHGITGRLDPGPQLIGNAYEESGPSIPTNWPEALVAFENSSFVRAYLGDKFARLFVQTRRGEMLDFNTHVSALEHSWYLGSS